MLVLDAGCLFELVCATPRAERVASYLEPNVDQLAPHLIDVEVFGAIRKQLELGRLDETAARQAVRDLRDWPGDRIGHRPLLERAWELRHRVRGHDATYVALAEAVDAPLLTTDARLARANGPRCQIITID